MDVYRQEVRLISVGHCRRAPGPSWAGRIMGLLGENWLRSNCPGKRPDGTGCVGRWNRRAPREQTPQAEDRLTNSSAAWRSADGRAKCWQSAPSGGSDLCDKEASRAARQSVRHAADDNHGVLGRGCRAHERGGTASAREWQNGIKAEERLVVSRVFGCTGFLGPHSSRNSA